MLTSKYEVLRGRDVKIIANNRERLVVWKEYIEELYRTDSTGASHKTPEVENRNQNNIGSSIMIEEIELAIKKLKRNKAAGIDHLSGELLVALEGTGKEILSYIITESYETGEVPEDFEKCVMIPIQK